MKVDNLASY